MSKSWKTYFCTYPQSLTETMNLNTNRSQFTYFSWCQHPSSYPLILSTWKWSYRLRLHTKQMRKYCIFFPLQMFLARGILLVWVLDTVNRYSRDEVAAPILTVNQNHQMVTSCHLILAFVEWFKANLYLSQMIEDVKQM